MSSRRILHAADIHLDSPLQKLDHYENAPADRIRSASRDALSNLTDLAIDQQVDLVVIAGDLYDGDWPDQNTGLAFVGQASRLVAAGIPLLVIRGNHDAANLMTSSLPLPKNPDGSDILFGTDKAETRRFDDLSIAVHGQSFRSRAETNNLANGYPDPLNGMFNLGLLHTGLEGNSSHAHYAPCTPQQLTDKGYDYWALGHIHQRQDHAISGGPPIVFSGNLQGRHIREQGPKGCILIDVDSQNRCEYQFHPLDVLRWQEWQLDMTGLLHPEQIHDRYQSWLDSEMERCEGRLLVPRVRLIGESPLHDRLHQEQQNLRSELQAISVAKGGDQVWLEDLRIRTRPPADSHVAVDLEGPLESVGHVVEEMLAQPDLRQMVENELAELSQKLPAELKGDPADAALPMADTDWIQELIQASAADVRSRLNDQPTSDQ